MRIVADYKIVVNVDMGIRHIEWGEVAKNSYNSREGQYFLKITYKNNTSTFYYETETPARQIFENLRAALLGKNKRGEGA